ncbi:MAG: Lrp/AsnC ligand binding domain-containing protein [Candidatus Heimdallarchaeota archaeon]|nr:Lrp/AsnC ligand binding domain-containing protein [Candidatus Heimdallarchaeota archaeon]
MTTQADILLNCILGKEKELLEELNKLEEVKEGNIIMGLYDIIIKVEVPDTKDLRPLLTQKIKVLSGIRQSMTVIIV